MSFISYILIQLITMIMLAPLVGGIIKKVKALSQKRKGPPVFQLYFDLYKLFSKDVVVSETASWIFKATPYITFTVILLAALFIPVSSQLKPVGFLGDIILAVYLLALGRFFMVLAGMDTGSTFGGMGSSREMMLATLIEPSLLVSLFTIGLVAGSTSIHQMIQNSIINGMNIFRPVYLLTFAALFIILIVETARVPVDDPATHLELTMIHEAMLLEYSGRYLALMEWGTAVKELILITLLANLFIPLDGLFHISQPVLAFLISLGLYIVKVIFIALIIALVEIKTVKLRLFSLPNLAALSFILSLLGFFQYWVVGR